MCPADIMSHRLHAHAFLRLGILITLLLAPSLCTAQIPIRHEETRSDALYHYRDFTMDDWNIGLRGTYGELSLSDSLDIVWADKYATCRKAEQNNVRFSAMPYSRSETFRLDEHSRISFFHSISIVGSLDSHTLPSRFPTSHVAWRLRLCSSDASMPGVTLDSMVLHIVDIGEYEFPPRDGFIGVRSQEAVHLVFGVCGSLLEYDSLHMIFDMYPTYLRGCDYQIRTDDIDMKFSELIDKHYGDNYIDGIRATGSSIVSIQAAGADMTGVNVVIADAAQYRLYRCSENEEQCVFSGQLSEGFSRVIFLDDASDTVYEYVLRDDTGHSLARHRVRDRE